MTCRNSYSLANEGINRDSDLPSPESHSVILQQILAVDEVGVNAAKSIDISSLA